MRTRGLNEPFDFKDLQQRHEGVSDADATIC